LYGNCKEVLQGGPEGLLGIEAGSTGEASGSEEVWAVDRACQSCFGNGRVSGSSRGDRLEGHESQAPRSSANRPHPFYSVSFSLELSDLPPMARVEWQSSVLDVSGSLAQKQASPPSIYCRGSNQGHGTTLGGALEADVLGVGWPPGSTQGRNTALYSLGLALRGAYHGCSGKGAPGGKEGHYTTASYYHSHLPGDLSAMGEGDGTEDEQARARNYHVQQSHHEASGQQYHSGQLVQSDKGEGARATKRHPCTEKDLPNGVVSGYKGLGHNPTSRQARIQEHNRGLCGRDELGANQDRPDSGEIKEGHYTPLKKTPLARGKVGALGFATQRPHWLSVDFVLNGFKSMGVAQVAVSP